MSRMCEFCSKDGAKYDCPKCNVCYCSLECYRSPRHYGCSEKFYKDWVQEELNFRSFSEGGESIERRNRMLDTFSRLNQAEEHNDAENSEESLDSDDELELEERMAGVNLDDSETVWKRMSKEERREFEQMIKSGDIQKIIPTFTPWWNERIEVKRVEEISNGATASDKEIDILLKKCPVVEGNIADLTSMTSVNPSPLVKFGLLNVLYAYAYAVKYFSGDHWDESNRAAFAVLVLTLSDNLSRGVNYESADTALESAATNVNIHNEWALTPDFTRGVKKDVFQIVRGPGHHDHRNVYLLSALSDLKRMLKANTAKKKRSTESSKRVFSQQDKDLPPWKREPQFVEPEIDAKSVKRAVKKVDFYLSWLKDHASEYDILRDN